MVNLTLGSLFDGSGGFPLGGLISGITPVWAAEIEPFPIRVTTKRLPFMKHYGDISTMDGSKIEPVDIITFGSPCQDLSVAGGRGGLDGKRSGLFYEAVRIIKEMRCATDGKKPRYIVWENVPGAFSSNKGEDFRCVLESICQIKDETVSIPKVDKWEQAGDIVGDHFSLAWRVLDAQYWGVPQRRKRIFLVADFTSESAEEILFKSEGLSGYSKEGFRAWQGATGYVADSTGETGTICLNDQGGSRMDITKDVTCTLRAKANHPPCAIDSAVFYNHGQSTCFTGPIDVAPTVVAKYGTGGNNQPFVVENVNKHAVIYAIDRETFNCGQSYAKNLGITEDGINSTLNAQGPGAVAIPTHSPGKIDYTVRRLTPTECARLQGFPDWWCSDLGTDTLRS
jgi:DNA (cytosine-5)-methyltransferase 1